MFTYAIIAGVGVALITAVSRVWITWLALRGSMPGERPAILRALAQCWKSWPARRQ